ncbi:MAG: Uma2 family endonuclease [Pyrinomonadaceae bacterium]
MISPGSAIYDRNIKADTYGALGVRELWLVDKMAETLEVRTQESGGFGEGQVFGRGQQVTSSVFPALNVNTEQIFADDI